MKGIRVWGRSALCLCLALTVAAAWVGAADAPKDKSTKTPGKLELGGARHRLEKFEDKVRRARGAPFKLGYVEKEALRRILALKDKYPGDPVVAKLYERARTVILASEGKLVEITKAMLQYRENEKKMKKMFAAEGEKAWAAYKQKLAHAKKLIEKAFPPPSHEKIDMKKLIGKVVVLDQFNYPADEFTSMNRQFCFVGSGVRGYYYVVLSCREWLGAYEAFKRYRRFINRDIPEQMKWTLVGEITGIELQVPQAAKEKTLNAYWGWRVRPMALYVPGCTFSVADPELELGGTFAGEERMEEIKSVFYTVKKIPEAVTPQRLTEIYATAIKEKNYPLYLECIDPNRRKTKAGLSRCMYHWEWHQHRFATFYCRVDVDPASITVLEGFDTSADSLKGRFLTDEERAKLKKVSMPLVEQALLRSRAFDERGKQYGSPKPRVLRRIEKRRWHIINYDQPF